MATRRLRTPRCVPTHCPSVSPDCNTVDPHSRDGKRLRRSSLSPTFRVLEFCADTVDGAQIGLSQDKDKLPLLCILDPFLAGNEVLVTPCVPLHPSHIHSAPHSHNNITYDMRMHSVVVLILDKTLKVGLIPPSSFLTNMPIRTPSSQPASAECTRSRHPLLAPTRLLPLHYVPGARGTQRALPRSRSARRDGSRRTAIPHLQRRFRTLVQSSFYKQHRLGRLSNRRPRSAHAPIPYRPGSWRHQAHIRTHSVRLLFSHQNTILRRYCYTYCPRQCDPHSHSSYRVRSSTRLSHTGAWRSRDQRACGLVVASSRKETRRGYGEGALRF